MVGREVEILRGKQGRDAHLRRHDEAWRVEEGHAVAQVELCDAQRGAGEVGGCNPAAHSLERLHLPPVGCGGGEEKGRGSSKTRR